MTPSNDRTSDRSVYWAQMDASGATPVLRPVSWSAHLQDELFDALLVGDMDICVTIRKPFRTVTVVVFPRDGDRYVPAGTLVKRVPLYVVP